MRDQGIPSEIEVHGTLSIVSKPGSRLQVEGRPITNEVEARNFMRDLGVLNPTRYEIQGFDESLLVWSGSSATEHEVNTFVSEKIFNNTQEIRGPVLITGYQDGAIADIDMDDFVEFLRSNRINRAL